MRFRLSLKKRGLEKMKPSGRKKRLLALPKRRNELPMQHDKPLMSLLGHPLRQIRERKNLNRPPARLKEPLMKQEPPKLNLKLRCKP